MCATRPASASATERGRHSLAGVRAAVARPLAHDEPAAAVEADAPHVAPTSGNPFESRKRGRTRERNREQDGGDIRVEGHASGLRRVSASKGAIITLRRRQAKRAPREGTQHDPRVRGWGARRAPICYLARLVARLKPYVAKTRKPRVCGAFQGGAYGIRTRAAAVRGRCPRPLDECARRLRV